MEPNKCEGWQWITWAQLREYAESDLQSSEEGKKMLMKPMVEFVVQRAFDPFKVLQDALNQNGL